MKIIKHKKGELTTQQIVMLIILVTSFAIILLFLFRLNLGEVSNKEICHNSVVLKGKASISGNLDCNTNYLCISGGGDCKGINPTITKEINLNDDVDDKDEIMKAIADEMVDCWWMFGEGKIDYAGISVVDVSCAICSIVRFDKNIQEEITYEDLSRFLKKNKKDKTQTYFDYLFENEIPKVMETSDPILYEEQYTIITGRRDAIKAGIDIRDPIIVPVHFIKTSDLTEEITTCTVFDLTKA